MSFYNSLKVLKNKIDQKNIVLISGNIDEIFSMVDNNVSKEIKPEIEQTYSLTDFILEEAQLNKYDYIEMYHSSKGIINFSNKHNPKQEDKDFDDLDDQADTNTKPPLNVYLKQITSTINQSDDLKKKHSCLYIIDSSDIYFDKSGAALEIVNIAELLTNFISLTKQSINKFIDSRKKIIFLCRFPQVMNSVIQSNNSEFASVTIQKPDYNERETFFKKFGGYFDVKNTINNPDHQDFKDAVIITDGLSFREIWQYSKLHGISREDLTFKQLYNLATFNKVDSDWEKFDYKKIASIDKTLSERVKGQDFAIEAIKKTLKRTFTGLNGISHFNNSKKPKGILFFVGPTGTGKTELAKSLTEFVFGDENRMIRFDMSEYNHEHSDQRLIGAPPGYVGYDAGGQLTNAVKENPFSVLLFDEIEKSHGKIFDKFLQILEDGRLTSAQGEIIDFSETFIIFTSNIGTANVEPGNDNEIVREKFMIAVKEHFSDVLNRLEILNRIGEKNIIPFNFITDLEIQGKIVSTKIDRIVNNLKKEKLIRLSIEDKNMSLLIDLILSKINIKMGGRGIMTELETIFIDSLSDFMFEHFEKFKNSHSKKEFMDITLKIENKKLIFDF